MLPSHPRSTELPLRLSAPGKVFVLGEYAVLAEHPAMVAAVGPRFELTADLPAESAAPYALERFHPQSPAGKLIAWADRMDSTPLEFQWSDPHSGQGGFGGSTAQFALVYWTLAEIQGWPKDWASVWRLYRELTAVSQGLPPSGADLVSQWNGGVSLFESRGGNLKCEDLISSPVWEHVLVFSAAGQAGRKVATHEHLAKLNDRGFVSELGSRLEKPLLAGISAVKEGNVAALGAAFDAYGEVLRNSDLELEATSSDRRILRTLPGVLGVKGAGAMQADGLLVVLGAEASARTAQGAALRKQVLQTARARNLKLVTEGIGFQNGITVGSCLN